MTASFPALAADDVSSELFESFADVPAAWRDICGQDDLAMDVRVLQVVQRALADQCRCWGMMVYDASHAAIGCAALALFHTDLIQSSHPLVIRWRDRIRRCWPGFARMKVLFCGLPVPAGSTHVRVRRGADAQAVFAELDRAMQRLARLTRCRMVVVKELNDNEAALAQSLSALGYVRGALPPKHVLRASFQDFAEFRNALKSRYRAQVMRSQKKLAAGGFEVLNGRGTAFFAEHFDEHLYALYVEMQRRAQNKLELMPLSFFQGMGRELGDDAFLTLLRRGGKACAFTFGVMRGGIFYNTYSGVDYELNGQGDLYFNLFYASMNVAFRSGVSVQHLGQTSDAFKSRLGTATQDLSYWVKARPAALNAALRLFAPLMSPRVQPVETHDVFGRGR